MVYDTQAVQGVRIAEYDTAPNAKRYVYANDMYSKPALR